METLGTAVLTEEIPATRAITTIVSRVDIADALKHSSPELFLDLEHGSERSTVGISWTHAELEQLLDRASGDDILFAFDRDQLQLAFDDVEAHGLRERALVFTVAVAGALGSSAAIANAAPVIERGGDGAASVATVQSLATDSIAATGAITSNVHTPGLQTGDETSAAPAASVRVAAPNSGLASNVHTPGLQIGDEGSMAAAASVKLSTEPSPAVADEAVSNVHTPGLQIGPGESTGATRSVQVSAGSSDGEFLGIDTRDATEALIAGGVLLAIAGATFAGARRPGSARPA